MTIQLSGIELSREIVSAMDFAAHIVYGKLLKNEKLIVDGKQFIKTEKNLVSSFGENFTVTYDTYNEPTSNEPRIKTRIYVEDYEIIGVKFFEHYLSGDEEIKTRTTISRDRLESVRKRDKRSYINKLTITG